ncbi:unnamed protein product, partial [Phaeothamnion confervicola]
MRVGEPPQLFLILWGLWLFEVVRGDHAPARDLGHQLQALEREQNVQFPLAHYATGCSMFWLGDFDNALATLGHAIAVYDHDLHGRQVGLHSQDPKAVSLLYQGWALWTLGYPDQALTTCVASAAWAENLSHPFSLAFAHDYCAVVHHLRREHACAGQRGEAAIAVSGEHGFPLFKAWGEMMCGKAQCDAGARFEGIRNLQQGLADYEATGAGMGKTLFLSLLADAQLSNGQFADGLASIAVAKDFAALRGEDAFLPELLRLEGELLSGADPLATTIAESCFVRALEHARRQHAKSWELRAATSLARLWQTQ